MFHAAKLDINICFNKKNIKIFVLTLQCKISSIFKYQIYHVRMENQPLVSIILPVYNVEKYLNECVDSIIAQTYKNIEIILVDDGSLDRSPQICDEYAAKYQNIRGLHKENGGASSARNVGLDESAGDYIMFVDSDDTIDEKMVEHMLNVIKEKDVDVVACQRASLDGVRVEKVNEKTPFGKADRDLVVMALLYDDVDMSACLKLYKKSAIGNLRFVNGVTNEDFVFLLNIYSNCKSVYFIREQYYNYRYNPNSVTNVFSAHYFDRLDNIKFVYANEYLKAPCFDVAKRVCLSRRHIDTAIEIRRFGCKNKYADRLRISENYVRKKLSYILFSREIGWRYKVKTAFVLFKMKFFLK
jgi:glycosyltransferase involved in cell wall biosynthesis